jgi:hypothetical protein
MFVFFGEVLCWEWKVRESIPMKLNPVSACSYMDRQLTHNSWFCNSWNYVSIIFLLFCGVPCLKMMWLVTLPPSPEILETTAQFPLKDSQLQWNFETSYFDMWIELLVTNTRKFYYILPYKLALWCLDSTDKELGWWCLILHTILFWRCLNNYARAACWSEDANMELTLAAMMPAGST